jgi:hypothetical protein
MTRLLLLLVLIPGCGKKTAKVEDAGWHPYKNVTPAKVKQKVDDIEQKHEEAMDKKFDEAQKQ